MTTSPPRVPGVSGPRWSRWVGRFLARVVWDTQIVGAAHVPTDGPFILAANHTGLMDGPVVLGVAPRPVHMIVKESLFTGALGVLLRAAGQIPIDQDGERDGGRSALVAALAVLRRGGGIGIFPEGNRGRGDAASARAGVAWLAMNGRALVVPVAVLGTRRTGEPVGRLPAFRRRLVVEFGAPVVVERAPGVSGKKALEDAHETVRTALAVLVAGAVQRTGLVLPTDDPNRAEPL